jgi:hypothetical protein
LIEGIKESPEKKESSKKSLFGGESLNIPGWANQDSEEKIVIVSDSPEVVAISSVINKESEPDVLPRWASSVYEKPQAKDQPERKPTTMALSIIAVEPVT